MTRLALGSQGTRTFLSTRGVEFRVINPSVAEVQARVEELRSHGRHKGHKGCTQAADLLDTLINRATGTK